MNIRCHKRFYKGIWMIGLLALAFAVILNGCGSSGESCDDDCTQGERRCLGSANAYELCGNYDSDSCLEWGEMVECAGGDTCTNGSCASSQSGLVLTGELSLAAAVMTAGSMQLSGQLSKDFARQQSQASGLTLKHVGFTSSRQGD